MDETDTTRDPESLVHFARHYAELRQRNSAIKALKVATQSGFVCSPNTLTSDGWLSKLRKHSEFGVWLIVERSANAG